MESCKKLTYAVLQEIQANETPIKIYKKFVKPLQFPTGVPVKIPHDLVLWKIGDGWERFRPYEGTPLVTLKKTVVIRDGTITKINIYIVTDIQYTEKQSLDNYVIMYHGLFPSKTENDSFLPDIRNREGTGTCQGFWKNGRKCTHPAKYGGFCGFHKH